MADIKVGMFTLGMIGTNCYFVFNENAADKDGNRHCIFFDPADRGAKIYETLKENPEHIAKSYTKKLLEVI